MDAVKEIEMFTLFTVLERNDFIPWGLVSSLAGQTFSKGHKTVSDQCPTIQRRSCSYLFGLVL